MTNVVTPSAESVRNPTGAGTPADALGVTKRMSTSETDGKESYECPDCSYTSQTWHGVKIHYGRIHEGTLKPTITCEWCGDEKVVKPKNQDQRFCSKDCHYAWKRGGERPTAEELERLHWREGLSLNQLSAKYDVGGHQTVARWFEHYGLKYRNNAEANRKLNAERNDHDEIVRAAHEAVHKAVKNGEWHLQTDNPKRNGYGAGWTEEKKEKVREMYDRTCQACGLPESGSLARFGTKLDVHHIIPAGHFDDPGRRNSVENLVPLCRSCHRRWEGIPLRPETI